MLYSSLGDYYNTMNVFIEYKYNPEYIETLIPFERDLQLDFIIKGEQSQPNQIEAPED